MSKEKIPIINSYKVHAIEKKTNHKRHYINVFYFPSQYFCHPIYQEKKKEKTKRD